MKSGRLFITVGILALTACRPAPGEDPYADMEVFPDAPEVATEFLEGPDPYLPGEERLSFGVYYEGDYSETREVDNQTRWLYIYDLAGDGTGAFTYTNTVSTSERREGLRADIIIHTGHTWWGGGITWDNLGDLSDWTTLHISLLSSSEAFADIDITVEAGISVSLKASDYGYTNDGQWHDLAISLDDFATRGADLTQVFRPFALSGRAGDEGEQLLVDNLYLTKD